MNGRIKLVLLMAGSLKILQAGSILANAISLCLWSQTTRSHSLQININHTHSLLHIHGHEDYGTYTKDILFTLHSSNRLDFTHATCHTPSPTKSLLLLSYLLDSWTCNEIVSKFYQHTWVLTERSVGLPKTILLEVTSPCRLLDSSELLTFVINCVIDIKRGKCGGAIRPIGPVVFWPEKELRHPFFNFEHYA